MITIFSRISDLFLIGVDREMEVEKAISVKYGNQIALINTVLTFQGGVYVYYLLDKTWILGVITFISLLNLLTFPP